MIVLPSSGCGDERTGSAVPIDEPRTASTATTTPRPEAPGIAPTGPTGPAPAATPEVPPTAAAPSTGGAPALEGQPGGAGDEEPVRTPAAFTVDGSVVGPASITVPPFLAVELTVRSKDDVPHQVKLVGTDLSFALGAGATVTRTLPGLQAGMYALLVDGGAGAASLVVGDEAGP